MGTAAIRCGLKGNDGDEMDTLTTWMLLLGATSLPFVMSTVGLVVQLQLDRTDPGDDLREPAGRWLRGLVAARGESVTVEVHPHTGVDAYWPGTGAIGLSEGTYASQKATAYAVAAHELGHALNMGRSPLVADLLPTARLARIFAFRTFAAGLLGAALFASPWLLVLALGFLILALASSAVIVADEALASQKGMELLRADRYVPLEAERIAARSMKGAFAVYAAGMLGELVVLTSFPVLATVAVPAGSMSAASAPAEPWVPAVWVLVGFVPFLLLRAAHVISRVLRPEPVSSDFRLFTVMHRESQWEFLAGFGVLLVVLGLHDLAATPVGQLATVLATTTAVGPVAGLLRALLLVPVLLALHHLGWLPQREQDIVLLPEARNQDAAPALMALYSDPPWYLRVSWVAHVAYLPLLLVLSYRLSGLVSG